MTIDTSTNKLAIVGAGNMGAAILTGLIDGGARPEDIVICEPNVARAEALCEAHGLRAASSAAEAVEDRDVVILALKPQVIVDVLAEIAPARGQALFVSVAAGVPTAKIEATLGGRPRVVRAMPNTPALIKQGATAVAKGAFASDDDLAVAISIFCQVGIATAVDEAHLDAVTGLSGSAPAYVMLIVEALADAGVRAGLPRSTAMELVVQTIAGAAQLLQQTGEHPGKLKDQVTSPGGTTIAGIHALEAGGLRATIMNAVHAATLRAQELGRGE